MKESHTCYQWKVVADERWLTPMSDPMVYEYSFDYEFDTPREAVDMLYELNADYDPATWVLVKVVTTKIVQPVIDEPL